MKRSILMPIHQFFPIIGGAEQQAQRLAASLKRRGHEVTVLTGRWDRAFPRREIIDGVYVYRCTTLWPFLARLGRLNIFRQYAFEASLLWYQWRHRNRIDIIHVHQALHAAVFSTFIARLLGKRVIIKVGCGGDLSDLKMMKGCRVTPFGEYFWRIIKKCDRIVAINSEIEQELLEDGFTRKQVIRIPNGISLDHVSMKKNYAVFSKVNLISVGRLDPQKGFDILIEAVSNISRFHYHCNIFGGGREKDALEELKAQKGLGQTVTLHGIVFDLPQHLPDKDVFILASRAEGLSNALLEAMATGMPCITTNIGGNRDLVAPERESVSIPQGEYLVGSNGVLVNVDDAVGLLKAIERLGTDQNLRHSLGVQARRWVLENCSLESVTERYLLLYGELLQGN
jgi:glycosyltransferase involved in cell wall biosynthesis